MIKILEIDIETIANLVDAWGLFNQNIGINQIHSPSEMVCFASKWYRKDDITFLGQTDLISKRKMLHTLWKQLDEADAVIHYNGKKFDIPTINKEFILEGFNPPSPYKQIDLYMEVKKNFRLPSYKLDFVCQYFGLGSKVQHEGHELWMKIRANDKDAWRRFQEYNEQDVLLLEKLYDKIKAWIKNHPNMGLYVDSDKPVCRICGSTNLVKKGTEITNLSSYQRFKCKDCSANLRGRLNLANRNNLTVGVN